MQRDKKPKFSICICNRNMQDTLGISIASILVQIDERFEVVVVDDGSSDRSLSILEDFQSNYSNFKYFSLPSDKSRKLGITRNISIEKALGDWVILHLDADDVVGEGLIDFVEDVLKIHSVDSTPILYSGHQIHMAPREWLLSFGPYRNLYRLEDRDLYQRLIPGEQWRILKHKPFINRLIRDRRSILRKTVHDAFDHLVSDSRYRANFLEALGKEFSRKTGKKPLLKFYRIFLLPFAFKVGRKLGTLETSNGNFSDQGVRLYREGHAKNADEWCQYLSSLE
jgi:glycosyltransferase involved in cell wall biosynthesis